MDTIQVKRTFIDKKKGHVMINTVEQEAGKEPAGVIKSMPAANIILDETNYREAVEALMRLKSDKPIGNSVPSHAAILFEAFFKNAQSRIRIFCKNLNNQVFGNTAVVEAARQALLRPDVGIDILIQDTHPDAGVFAKFLEENRQNPSLRIRRVEKEATRNSSLNFSVMDKQAIRFEKDRKEVKAFAIMNAPQLAEVLAEKFETMFAEASPLLVQPGLSNVVI